MRLHKQRWRSPAIPADTVLPGRLAGWIARRRRQLAEVRPNAAHVALAELAARWEGDFLLVTQNVDDLHDRAHAETPPAAGFELIHMHGELLKARCTRSGVVKCCVAMLSQVSPARAV